MNQELKTILDNIVADLRSQGHDPLNRPIVFMWSYPDEDLKYTLVIQEKEEEENEEDHGYVDEALH